MGRFWHRRNEQIANDRMNRVKTLSLMSQLNQWQGNRQRTFQHKFSTHTVSIFDSRYASGVPRIERVPHLKWLIYGTFLTSRKCTNRKWSCFAPYMNRVKILSSMSQLNQWQGNRQRSFQHKFLTHTVSIFDSRYDSGVPRIEPVPHLKWLIYGTFLTSRKWANRKWSCLLPKWTVLKLSNQYRN